MTTFEQQALLLGSIRSVVREELCRHEDRLQKAERMCDLYGRYGEDPRTLAAYDEWRQVAHAP